MKSNYIERSDCRICGSTELIEILDLGRTPLADAFIEPNQIPQERTYPLYLNVCDDCKLVQLGVDVDSELLFGEDYTFFSAGSPSSIKYFENYADSLIAEFPKSARHFTVEIASNDGLILKRMQDQGCKVLGIDPAAPAAAVAMSQGVETIVDFFTEESAKDIVAQAGQAGLIIANNVVAHVTDLKDFFRGIRTLLAPDGVFVFEVQYLPNLLFRNQFDNVYHEHRSFFSVAPLQKLCKKLGFKIISIRPQDTQGGSIRVFVTHKDSPAESDSSVEHYYQSEKKLGLYNLDVYFGFQDRVEFIKLTLREMLAKLKAQGKTIYGYGASAKSTTLLNYCGIGEYIDCVVDKTPHKYGTVTPGTHIPVFNQDKANKPDYYLLLVWNYLEGVLAREREYTSKGGKFIVPIPAPQII